MYSCRSLWFFVFVSLHQYQHYILYDNTTNFMIVQSFYIFLVNVIICMAPCAKQDDTTDNQFNILYESSFTVQKRRYGPLVILKVQIKKRRIMFVSLIYLTFFKTDSITYLFMESNQRNLLDVLVAAIATVVVVVVRLLGQMGLNGNQKYKY